MRGGCCRPQPVERRDDGDDPMPEVERLLQSPAQQRLVARADDEVRHRQLDRVLAEAVQPRPAGGRQPLAVDAQLGVALVVGPLGQIRVQTLAVDHQRREQADVLAAVVAQELRGNRLEALRLHRHAVLRAVLDAELHVEQPQEVVDLGHRRDRGLAAAARGALFDRHGRRDAVDRIDIRLARRLHDRACVGVERLEIAALALVEQDVEGERRLAAARDAGDHREGVARDLHVDALEVVLARVLYFDRIATGGGEVGASRLLNPGRASDVPRPARRDRLFALSARRSTLDEPFVLAQRLAGVRGGVLHHLPRRTRRHDFAAGVATFGPEVDDPVGRADHVEVVLDHDQRVAGRQQLAQRAHQPGHIVEVQAGGRLVEQQQGAASSSISGELACNRIGDAAPGGRGEKARDLQPLGLTAGQRGHGLAELHVLQPHVGDRLQRADHLAVVGKEGERLADGQFEHVGHRQLAAAARDRHFQHLGPEALAVAVGAAQVHVGQELHLDVLEAVAAAGRAAPVAGVEAEHAGTVVALDRQSGLGEQRADGVPGADVAGRVAARGLADRALVDHCHVGQVVVAEHTVVGAGRLGRLALGLAQGRVQHVLDQRALAGAGDARHHHQVVERELDAQVLQVVCARAFEQQARGVGPHVARGVAVGGQRGDLHLPAARQVLAGQRAGLPDRRGRAVEHDGAAALARAGAHVDDAVGRQHHLRVVLDHHQRVAGVAQAVHDLHHAVHVARVQADRGLVEHEQRVDERGAERGGQVDPLHFTAREGAALAVERQVAQPHVAQELESCAHFVEQQFGGVVQHAGEPDAVEERAHALDRQQHQVVDRQAGQVAQGVGGPVRVDGLVAGVARRAFTRRAVLAGRVALIGRVALTRRAARATLSR